MNTFTRVVVIAAVAFFGGVLAQSDAPAFFVNEQPVTEAELARARRADSLASRNFKGALGFESELLVLNQLVVIRVAAQDAAIVPLTSEEVDLQIKQIRDQNNLIDDAQYEAAIQGAGYSIESFRKDQEANLRIQKRISELQASGKASEAELKFLYELSPQTYAESGKQPAAFATLTPEQRDRLEFDAKKLKQDEAIEAWVAELTSNAQVRFPEGSSLEWFNPVVASVDGFEIRLDVFLREVYSNPEVGRFIEQAEAHTTEAFLSIFKARALERLIDTAVAAQYASRSDQPFFGMYQNQFEQIQQFITQNIQISEVEARAYYLKNKSSYSTQASAELVVAAFSNSVDAKKFRQQLLKSQGENMFKLAAQNHGAASELGRLDADKLIANQTDLLKPEKLTRVKQGHVSKVINGNGQVNVYLVTDFQPASVQPFEAVRQQVSDKARMQAQEKAASIFWAAERKNHEIINNLGQVQAELEARAKR